MILIVFLVFLVYPSLESDEEDLANKAKMKRKKNWEDTPWSPKGNHSDQAHTGFLFVMIIEYYFFLRSQGDADPPQTGSTC